MAEYIDLAEPEMGVPEVPSTGRWYVERLDLFRGMRWDPGANAGAGAVVPDPARSRITVILIGEHAHTYEVTYTGEEADDLLVALNTANLTLKSLHRRVLEKVVADGLKDGTIASE